jgi:hypothetical protein
MSSRTREALFIAVVLSLSFQHRINQRIKESFSHLYNDHDVNGRVVGDSDDGYYHYYYYDTIEDHGNNYYSKMINTTDDTYGDTYDNEILYEQSNVSMSNLGALVEEDIQLQIQKYREERGDHFDSWFDKDNKLIRNADKNGAILDFAISGKIVTVILYESKVIIHTVTTFKRSKFE